MHSYLSAHLLRYVHTDLPEINVPVYLHASLSSNHKDLPVTTTTCVPAHRCTRSWSYLFIFILSFRLTAKIYSSTFLLFYLFIDVPVHQYTCSVYLFLSGITCTIITFELICWGTYIHIYPKINYCLKWAIPPRHPIKEIGSQSTYRSLLSLFREQMHAVIQAQFWLVLLKELAHEDLTKNLFFAWIVLF